MHFSGFMVTAPRKAGGAGTLPGRGTVTRAPVKFAAIIFSIFSILVTSAAKKERRRKSNDGKGSAPFPHHAGGLRELETSRGRAQQGEQRHQHERQQNKDRGVDVPLTANGNGKGDCETDQRSPLQSVGQFPKRQARAVEFGQ